jgi:hypothetical protein
MVEALLLVATLTWLWALPRSLRTRASPRGLVSLALARTPSRARRIRSRWVRLGRLETARATLGWELALIALYAITLLLGIVLAARLAESRAVLSGTRDDIVDAAPYVIAVAAGLDLLENVGSWVMLRRAPAHPLITVATWNFAWLKFVLIAAVIGAILAMVAASGIAAVS